MGHEISQPDSGGDAFRVGRVMPLDRGGDRSRQSPAADQDRTDQRVVDPQLAPLEAEALVRVLVGSEADAELLSIELAQDEPPHVVEQRSHREFVALRDARHVADAVRGSPHGHRVPAEALVPVAAGAGCAEQVVRVSSR